MGAAGSRPAAPRGTPRHPAAPHQWNGSACAPYRPVPSFGPPGRDLPTPRRSTAAGLRARREYVAAPGRVAAEVATTRRHRLVDPPVRWDESVDDVDRRHRSGGRLRTAGAAFEAAGELPGGGATDLAD